MRRWRPSKARGRDIIRRRHCEPPRIPILSPISGRPSPPAPQLGTPHPRCKAQASSAQPEPRPREGAPRRLHAPVSWRPQVHRVDHIPPRYGAGARPVPPRSRAPVPCAHRPPTSCGLRQICFCVSLLVHDLIQEAEAWCLLSPHAPSAPCAPLFHLPAFAMRPAHAPPPSITRQPERWRGGCRGRVQHQPVQPLPAARQNGLVLLRVSHAAHSRS